MIGIGACNVAIVAPAGAHNQDSTGNTNPSPHETAARVDSAADRHRTEGSPGEIVSDIDNSCWIIFQDKNNNYWFGSDGQGVSRYDGKTITRFTTKHGLCDDHVRGIQQHGPSGDILVSTNGGVSKFDGKQFVTLPVTEMKSPAQGWVLNVDDVWLAFQPQQLGPYRYDGKTLYHLKFPKSPRDGALPASGGNPKPAWSPYEVYSTYRDRKGHMWFGTGSLGIYRFDGRHVDWMYEDHLTNTPEGGSFGIRSMIEDKNGAFWFSNTQFRFITQPHSESSDTPGRIAYSREPGIDLSQTPYSDKFLYIMSMVADERGDLWMALYGGGVWKYDGTKLTNYPLKDGEKEITMFSICKDRRGDLWVGTHEYGPFKFNGKAFERFRP